MIALSKKSDENLHINCRSFHFYQVKVVTREGDGSRRKYPKKSSGFPCPQLNWAQCCM